MALEKKQPETSLCKNECKRDTPPHTHAPTHAHTHTHTPHTCTHTRTHKNRIQKEACGQCTGPLWEVSSLDRFKFFTYWAQAALKAEWKPPGMVRIWYGTTDRLLQFTAQPKEHGSKRCQMELVEAPANWASGSPKSLLPRDGKSQCRREKKSEHICGICWSWLPRN